MNNHQLLTRPHRLLLARFFSRGLIAAVVVTFIVGAALTRLERDNYLRHATNAARERVARLAAHIGHQLENPTATAHNPNGATSEELTPVQQLVVQETKNSGLLRLDVINSAGVIIGSSDPAALQQKPDAPEVTEARLSDQIISRVEGSGQTSFLRFAAPLHLGDETYIVLVDEPLNELEALTRDSRNTVTLSLTIGFALTFAILGFVVRRAGLELERHQNEEERVKDLLGRYVSHQVAQQILAHGGLAVCAERREITVLFADIRGFTTFSEKLPPERVVALLNDYLAAMTDVVFKYDGTVDKFLGDGLMTIFGAPLSHRDEVCRAVACAQEMQVVFNQLRLKWRSEGLPDLGLGIGLNTGEAVVGSIGSARRLDYTAIGDVVNTAQRLQSIAAAGQILLSAATRACLDGVAVDALGPKQVKGKREAIEVFSLAAG
ncbi:MAG: adenylate/guanylate cyclase domain-containing protein [Anaerolineae bacterium]|nr:adenylate/guanylate cyclase domain-containing protein [Anaerolineae bacterium]